MKLNCTKIILFLFVTIIASAAENDSGSIEGFVFNDTGKPLANVYVQILNYNGIDVTDAQGHYLLESIPEGIYELKFEYIGYQTKILKNITVQTGRVTVLDTLIMEQKILETSTMVVTARRITQSSSDLSSPLNVINQETIQERSAKTSAEALREEAGVFVQKTNHGGGSAIIRGLSSNQILLLIDGIRLNNSLYRLGNHQYLTTVDYNSLRQIEVVRGPSSSLYGSDALGGTINLLTKIPEFQKDQFGINYNLNSRYASADQEKTIRAETVLGNNNWAILSGLSYKNYGDVRRGKNSDYRRIEVSTNGAKQSPTAFPAFDFDSKLIYRFSEKQNLILAYQLSDQDEVPRYDKYAYDDYYKWVYEPQKRQLAYLTYNAQFNSHYLQSLRASVSLQNQEEGRKFQKSSTSTLTKELDAVSTIGINIQGNSHLSNQILTVGTELYFDRIESDRFSINPTTKIQTKDIFARYPDGARYNSYGVYIQDEINLNSKWITTLGGRYNYFSTNFTQPEDTSITNPFNKFDQDFQALTLSLGSVYKFTDYLHFNMNIGQAFRAPNLSDISKFGQSKGQTFEIPNPDLEPEKMLSIDAGIKINHPKYILTSSVYYSKITDLLSSADDTFNGLSTIEINGTNYKVKSKQNIGQAYIMGFEGSADFKISDDFLARFNLTSTDGQNTTLNEPVGGIPPTFGLFGLKWQKSKYDLETYVRFATKQDRLSADDEDDPRIPTDGTPPWQTLNFRGRYQVNSWARFLFAVENIFDYNYREHGSGINGTGRNFIISLSISNK